MSATKRPKVTSILNGKGAYHAIQIGGIYTRYFRGKMTTRLIARVPIARSRPRAEETTSNLALLGGQSYPAELSSIYARERLFKPMRSTAKVLCDCCSIRLQKKVSES